MDVRTRVAVFESEVQQEILLIRSKLEDAGIQSDVENNYMTFTTTPTATALKVMVDLENEQKAFEIIDGWLQANPNK